MIDLRLAEIAATGVASRDETRELVAMLRLARHEREMARQRASSLQEQLSNTRQRLAAEARVRMQEKQTKGNGEQ